MRNAHVDPARLLVVDDNKVNRLLLTRSLELQGHRVASAENGRRALEMLRLDAYDLLLLDMEMPEMDGFQVLEQLQKDVTLRDLPVIVTSSLEGIENVVRCIELGAEDYLSKPVNPVLLKARIGATLEKKRLRDQQKDLLRRFAAPEVAHEMQQSGFALGGKRIRGTVLFSDIRDFTSMAESQPPEETIDLLNTYYTLMFDAISTHGGIVTLIIGDGLMAISARRCHCRITVPAPCAPRRKCWTCWTCSTPSAWQRASRRSGSASASRPVKWWRAIRGQTRARRTRASGNTVNLASRIEAHTKLAQRAILFDAETRSTLGADVAVESLGELAFQGDGGRGRDLCAGAWRENLTRLPTDQIAQGATLSRPQNLAM